MNERFAHACLGVVEPGYITCMMVDRGEDVPSAMARSAAVPGIKVSTMAEPPPSTEE